VWPIQKTIELCAQASSALTLFDDTLVPDEVEVVAVLMLQVCASRFTHLRPTCSNDLTALLPRARDRENRFGRRERNRLGRRGRELVDDGLWEA
jgi:hypothetical protein